MQQLASFLSGTWQSGRGRSRLIHHAISGEALWEVTSEGLDMAAARQFAIEKGAPALRAMTFIERAAMLKAVAKHLLSEKERFYALSAQTGATRADSWVDIEGGIGTLFTYASLGSRELPDDTLWPEDELLPLSKEGGFAARHVLTSLRSGERTELFPIVVAGGTCAFNPEPLAPFVDLFVLGEGEDVSVEIIQLYRQAREEGWGKEEFLTAAARIPASTCPLFTR